MCVGGGEGNEIGQILTLLYSIYNISPLYCMYFIFCTLYVLFKKGLYSHRCLLFNKFKMQTQIYFLTNVSMLPD